MTVWQCPFNQPVRLFGNFLVSRRLYFPAKRHGTTKKANLFTDRARVPNEIAKKSKLFRLNLDTLRLAEIPMSAWSPGRLGTLLQEYIHHHHYPFPDRLFCTDLAVLDQYTEPSRGGV